MRLINFVPLLLFFISFQSKAQKVKAKYIFTNDTLYSGESNIIPVVIPEPIRKQAEVRASQGVIYTSDNQLFFIDSLKNGVVFISVLKKSNGKTVILERKKVIVATSPERALLDKYNINFSFSLDGYKGGKIPDSVIRKIKKITITPGYKFHEAVVYLSSPGFNEPAFRILKSEVFDEEFLELWKKIRPNVSIVFDEIKFEDQFGNKFVYPQSIGFQVVK